MFFMDVGKQSISQHQVHCCAQCGHSGAQLRGELKFVKLSFIPIIPFATHYQMQCEQCRNVSDATSQRPHLFSWFTIINKFVGSVILVAIMAYFISGYMAKQQQQQQFMAEPKVFDFYLLDKTLLQNKPYKRHDFTVAKVLAISGDNIELALGNYTYSRKRDLIKAIRLDTLLYEKFFAKKTLHISYQELQDLYQKEIIYQVLRPVNYSIFGGLAIMPEKPKSLYQGFQPNPINQDGIRAYRRGDFVAAFEFFQTAADADDAWAQLNLAQMYRDGEGVKINKQQALLWFKRAIDNGNSNAQFEYDNLCQQMQLKCEASLLSK